MIYFLLCFLCIAVLSVDVLSVLLGKGYYPHVWFDEDCKHLRGASDPAKVALSHPTIEVGDVKDSRVLF